MLSDYYFKHFDQIDLNLYHCGFHDCERGHYFGPSVRDHYLIHYILSGKGVFQSGNAVYHLKEGQGFLICPEDVTYYQADSEEPWSYCWVGFQGKKASFYLQNANLTRENPIFHYDKDTYVADCINNMIVAKDLGRNRDLQQLGFLYLLLSKLTEAVPENIFKNDNMNRKEKYVKDAVNFIIMNYSEKISIRQIAYHIGLDRSYFCSTFKECLHISPQSFLINYRINKACELMNKNDLNLGDIARSVGYADLMQFSKIFKKMKGVSPSAYRKNIGTDKYK